MNTISNGVYRPAQKLHPLNLLSQYISHRADGCLRISSSGSAWFLYLEQGRLVYASDLTDPFGRLDRHLRLLSIQAPSLVSAVRVQVRLMFEEMPDADQLSINSDYRAICWLVEQQHLTPDQAATLIEAMAREVIGAVLPIQMGSHEFTEQDLLVDLPKFCQLDLHQIAEECQNQFKRRQSALPATHAQLLDRLSINRPQPERSTFDSEAGQKQQAGYLSEYETEHHNHRTIGNIHARQSEYSVGYSAEPSAPHESAQYESAQYESAQFNLSSASPLNSPQSESYSHAEEAQTDAAAEIADLPFAYREPQAELAEAYKAEAMPAEAMPAEPSQQHKSYIQPAPAGIPPLNPTWSAAVKPMTPQWFSNHTQATPSPVAETNTKKYTIACIDDSPTVLQAINSFLDDKSFSVVLISDPIKALMQIIRSRPDLILLDVTMPNLDGYELCSLLRKHPSFRGTPIVMVTGNTGFIDRAKAKLVGSSGYLTKPFTQTDLIKMVFKHLN